MRFCTLSSNQRYTITLTPAESGFTFTYQTGLENPGELTAAEYDNLVSGMGEVNLSIASYWGTYPNTQGFTAFETDSEYIFLDEFYESDITFLPPVPTFDPVTGTLMIPIELLTAETQAVIISASAVKMEDEGCICEISCIAPSETCRVCRDSVEGCT